MEEVKRRKEADRITAYVFWFLCLIGLSGIHRFYLGRRFSGTLYLLSFGFLGIGQIVDLFLLPSLVQERNEKLKFQISQAQLPGAAESKTIESDVNQQSQELPVEYQTQLPGTVPEVVEQQSQEFPVEEVQPLDAVNLDEQPQDLAAESQNQLAETDDSDIIQQLQASQTEDPITLVEHNESQTLQADLEGQIQSTEPLEPGVMIYGLEIQGFETQLESIEAPKAQELVLDFEAQTQLTDPLKSSEHKTSLSLPELGEIINQQDIKGKESDEGETLRNKEGDNQQTEFQESHLKTQPEKPVEQFKSPWLEMPSTSSEGGGD